MNIFVGIEDGSEFINYVATKIVLTV